MFEIDPTQELVIDCYNPSGPNTILIDGEWTKDNKLQYLHAEMLVPKWTGAPSQIILPQYYDALLGLTAWINLLPAGFSSMFIHAYIRQGGASSANRVFNLFSGWVSASNPISYPPVSREDIEDNLAGIVAANCIVAPAPAMRFAPLLGNPIKVVGFTGSFTTSALVGNRTIGLGVVDGVPSFIELVQHPTLITAGLNTTVFGVAPDGTTWVSNRLFGIPLPNFEIRNPYEFRANIDGALAGDSWSACKIIYRPYFDA